MYGIEKKWLVVQNSLIRFIKSILWPQKIVSANFAARLWLRRMMPLCVTSCLTYKRPLQSTFTIFAWLRPKKCPACSIQIEPEQIANRWPTRRVSQARPRAERSGRAVRLSGAVIAGVVRDKRQSGRKGRGHQQPSDQR